MRRPDTREGRPLLLAAAAGLALLPACNPGGGGTDTGNAADAELFVVGQSQTTARALGGVDEAWVLLHELEFRPCTGGGDDEIDYEGDFEVDLLAGGALGVTRLSFDTICRLEFELKRDSSALEGSSILVDGTTEAGTPFELRSRREFEFEPEGRFTLAEVTTRLELLFDLDAWFDGVDLDAGTPDGDGVIRISETSNDALLDLVEARVDASAELLER